MCNKCLVLSSKERCRLRLAPFYVTRTYYNNVNIRRKERGRMGHVLPSLGGATEFLSTLRFMFLPSLQWITNSWWDFYGAKITKRRLQDKTPDWNYKNIYRSIHFTSHHIQRKFVYFLNIPVVLTVKYIHFQIPISIMYTYIIFINMFRSY